MTPSEGMLAVIPLLFVCLMIQLGYLDHRLKRILDQSKRMADQSEKTVDELRKVKQLLGGGGK